MNINRNNYEEFFVLYADNELSATEKQLVESFVMENPDLRQELNLLQQSKLVTDNNIVFENKELLMRSSLDTNSVINHSNYEEFFLLYLDNELNEEDKKAVEKFADRHPSLWHEMMLLQKVRIEPDLSVIYKGKEKLYKKENKKIFLLPWQRIAAASVVLLLAGLFVFKYASKKTNQSTLATDSNSKAQNTTAKKDEKPVTLKLADTLNNRSNTKENITAQQEQEAKQSVADIKTNQKKNPGKNKMNIVNEKSNGQKESTTQDNNNISPVIVRSNNNDEHKQINTDQIALQNNAVATITDLKTLDTKNPETETPTDPLNTQINLTDRVYQEDQTGIIAFSTKKNKMRGIFRRVSRVFEKTTNVEGDKSSVLIGNFQIAVK